MGKHVSEDGVSVSSGYLVRRFVDFELPTLHFPLSMVRDYSSSGLGADSPLGAGWSFPFGGRIVTLVDNQQKERYAVVLANGDKAIYKLKGGNPVPAELDAPQGRFEKLERTKIPESPENDPRWRFTYTTLDRKVLVFEEQSGPYGERGVYLLVESSEPHGVKLAYGYDHRGRLRDVAHSRSVRLTFHYEKFDEVDRVVRVECPSARLTVQYEYDADGRLRSAIRSGTNLAGQVAGATTVWKYYYRPTTPEQPDDPYLLERIEDPNEKVERIDWAVPDRGQSPWKELVVDKIHRAGTDGVPEETDYTWDWAAQTSTAEVKNARGFSTKYTKNGSGNVTEILEAVASGSLTERKTTFGWDVANQRKTSQKDALGLTTIYTYYTEPDQRNGLLKSAATDAGGDLGFITERWEYDPNFQRLSKHTDPDGRVLQQQIDPATGDVLARAQGWPNALRFWQFHYDAWGGLLWETDPRGARTDYRDTLLNPFGLPKQVDRPAGGPEVREYDARARLVSVKSAQASRRLMYDGQDRVRYEYGCEGCPDGDEMRVDRTYWPGGQLQNETNLAGLSAAYELDGRGRVRWETKKATQDGELLTTGFEYDGNGNLSKLTSARGVGRVMEYDALDRLTKVVLDGKTVERHVYANPLLEESSFGVFGEQTSYGYDTLHRLTTKTLPATSLLGVPLTESYTYDRAGHRLTVKDPNGWTTATAYDGLARVESVRNAKQQTTKYTYGDDVLTGSLTEPTEIEDVVRGVKRNREYDGLGRLTQETVTLTKQPAGTPPVSYVTKWAYAPNATGDGEVRTETRLGTTPQVVREELARGRLKSRTLYPDGPGGAGLQTTFWYDALGQVKVETRPGPGQRQTKWGRDGLGRVVTVGDARQRFTHSKYWGDEDLVKRRIDRRGVATDYTYDSLGRLLTESVSSTAATGPNYWEQSAQGWSREIAYDDVARKETAKDALQKRTITTFDGLHRPVQVDYELGQPSRVRWDGLDRKADVDQRGRETIYGYDELHRLTSVKNAAGDIVSTQYEDAVLQELVKDGRGTTTRQLDGLGRVLSVTRGGVVLESRTYDNLNNVLTSQDAGANAGEGLLKHMTCFGYDGANRLTSRREGCGTAVGQTTRFYYDTSGNLWKEIDPRTGEANPSREYAYDELDRRTSVKDGNRAEWTYDYDPEGNLITRTEPDNGNSNRTTDYFYDQVGKLTKVVQPSVGGGGQPETKYVYDRARNLTWVYDAESDGTSHATQREYDQLNREFKRTQHDTQNGDLVWQFSYWDDGSIREVTDGKGQKVASDYDLANRPKSLILTPSPTPAYTPWRHTSRVDFSDYDGNGNLQRIDEQVQGDGAGTQTLTTILGYDSFNRLTSVLTQLPDVGNRSVNYGYWPNGSLAKVSTPGTDTKYEYDELGRVRSVETPHGITRYGYWEDSLLKSVERPNGARTDLTYYPNDRLFTATTKVGTQTVNGYAYTYFDDGSRKTQVELNAGLSENTSYTYDALSRLRTVAYPPDPTFPLGGSPARVVTYGYDKVGNRLTETVTKADDNALLYSRTAGFDGANRLTSLTDTRTPGRPLGFAYDKNGNLARQVTNPSDPEDNVVLSYRYDLKDKLVEVLKTVTQPGPPPEPGQPPNPPSVTTTILSRFQNDWAGKRTKKVGDDGVVDFLHDGDSILAEYSELGTELARYEWGGDGLLSVWRPGEGRRYAHADGLGSLMHQTDESGSSVASFRWDAWGAPRFAREDLQGQKNRLGFTGHYFDTETNLYQARARYLDPDLGRFLSVDPFPGVLEMPESMNPYTYAHNGPTLHTDPTGEAIPLLVWALAATATAFFAHTTYQQLAEGRDVYTMSPSRGVEAGRAGMFGVASGAIILSGGTAGPWATAGWVAGGAGTSLAEQHWFGHKAWGEVSLEHAYVSGGFAALPAAGLGAGGRIAQLTRLGVAVGGGYGAYRGGQYAYHGYEANDLGMLGLGTAEAALGLLGAGWGARSFSRGLGPTVAGTGRGSQLSWASRTARSLLRPVFRGVGRLPAFRRSGRPLTGWDRARRFFVQDTQSYPGASYGRVGRWLKQRFPQFNWEQHHAFLQHKWVNPGGAHQWYPTDPLAQRGLQRITDAGWNLVPIPRSLNNALGRTALGTVGFAGGLAGVGAAGAYEAYEGFEALGAGDDDDADEASLP